MSAIKNLRINKDNKVKQIFLFLLLLYFDSREKSESRASFSRLSPSPVFWTM